MTQFILTLPHKHSVQAIFTALESQRLRLLQSVETTKQKLLTFENRYHVTTEVFLTTMSAEDLQGGDLEYIEWAGEAQMLTSLLEDIATLDYARTHIS